MSVSALRYGNFVDFVGNGYGRVKSSAGILEQSMRARNRVGVGLSYRPARLYRLAELIPGNDSCGLLKSLKVLRLPPQFNQQINASGTYADWLNSSQIF
jgi:hypothetical protein